MTQTNWLASSSRAARMFTMCSSIRRSRLQQAPVPGGGPESRAYFFSSAPLLRLIESRIDVSA